MIKNVPSQVDYIKRLSLYCENALHWGKYMRQWYVTSQL